MSSLSAFSPGISIPSEAAEAADPQLADESYETAIKALIERTRYPERFDRVFDENCQYGFRRNIWGCRVLGIWMAGSGLVVTAALGGLRAANALNVSVFALGLSGGVDLILLVVLAFAVRPAWVREAAEAYADRLLGSLEIL